MENQIRDFADKHFDKADSNGDGFLSFQEMRAMMFSPDFRSVSPHLKFVLRSGFYQIARLHNDSWGPDLSISRNDLNKLADYHKLPELKLIDEANRSTPKDKPLSERDFKAACEKFEQAIALTTRSLVRKDDIQPLVRRLNYMLNPSDEKEATLDTLMTKWRAPARVRYEYALLLNRWAVENDDRRVKAKSIRILRDIQSVDEEEFKRSSVSIALVQARAGTRIFDENRANAKEMVETALVAFQGGFKERASSLLFDAYLKDEAAARRAIDAQRSKLSYWTYPNPQQWGKAAQEMYDYFREYTRPR